MKMKLFGETDLLEQISTVSFNNNNAVWEALALCDYHPARIQPLCLKCH